MSISWRGVWPAILTPFQVDESLDLPAYRKLIDFQLDAGVHGLVILGTLGENGSMAYPEKLEVLKAAVDHVAGRVPVISSVAEGSTRMAIRYAADAAKLGIDGLMLLPTMIYKCDPRETMHHFRTVARSTHLPIMCYNNPISYGVDITPEMFVDLGDETNLVAIKESSDDPRRVTDIINLCRDRYAMFCGVDDLILESMLLGSTGWVAGLVNAFPAESVRIWELATAGRWEEARAIYRWFTPMLHLDTHVKLVQYIKLAASVTGACAEHLRSSRLPIAGAERERVLKIITDGVASRPKLS